MARTILSKFELDSILLVIYNRWKFELNPRSHPRVIWFAMDTLHINIDIVQNLFFVCSSNFVFWTISKCWPMQYFALNLSGSRISKNPFQFVLLFECWNTFGRIMVWNSDEFETYCGCTVCMPIIVLFIVFSTIWRNLFNFNFRAWIALEIPNGISTFSQTFSRHSNALRWTFNFEEGKFNTWKMNLKWKE